MKIGHLLFILDGVSEISRLAKTSINKDRLKRSISPFLEVGFENCLTAICRTT